LEILNSWPESGEYINKMNRSFKLFFLMSIIGIVGLLSFVVVNLTNTYKQAQVGLLAVKYLYHFSSLEELDANMDELKKISTPEVYRKLTIDNTDRSLNVYLKFKNKPVFVIPDKATDNYIIYRLQTENISNFRKFTFFYEVNKQGLISDVREAEIIDFAEGPGK
jgi:hypothetical protein